MVYIYVVCFLLGTTMNKLWNSSEASGSALGVITQFTCININARKSILSSAKRCPLSLELVSLRGNMKPEGSTLLDEIQFPQKEESRIVF